MMRNRRCASVVIAAACLLLASRALADDFSRNGVYVGASAAYGIQFLDTNALGTFLSSPPMPTGADDSWGLNVRYGQRLQSWFSLELEYEWMKGFDIKGPTGAVVATYDPDVATLNGRFFLPIWRAQPYLLVGAGLVSYDLQVSPPFSTVSISDNAFAFRGGAGVDVYLTKHIVLNAEATILMNTEDFNILSAPAIKDFYYLSVSAGLAYRF